MEQSEGGIQKSLVDCDGVVVGDENRLKQIITNLAGYKNSHFPFLSVLDLIWVFPAETLVNSPLLAERSRSLPNYSILVPQKSLG